MSFFPARRLRRLRKNEKMRDLGQEIRLSPKDLICPIFVQEDLKKRVTVESMADIERLPLNEVGKEIESIAGQKSITIINIKPGDVQENPVFHEYKTSLECSGKLADLLRGSRECEGPPIIPI